MLKSDANAIQPGIKPVLVESVLFPGLIIILEIFSYDMLAYCENLKCFDDHVI